MNHLIANPTYIIDMCLRIQHFMLTAGKNYKGPNAPKLSDAEKEAVERESSPFNGLCRFFFSNVVTGSSDITKISAELMCKFIIAMYISRDFRFDPWTPAVPVALKPIKDMYNQCLFAVYIHLSRPGCDAISTNQLLSGHLKFMCEQDIPISRWSGDDPSQAEKTYILDLCKKVWGNFHPKPLIQEIQPVQDELVV